jgi:hypothetical protein
MRMENAVRGARTLRYAQTHMVTPDDGASGDTQGRAGDPDAG